MHKSFKVSVNPHIFGMEETQKKSDEELISRVSSLFGMANSISKIKPSKIGILTPQYYGISYEYKGDHNSLSFHINSPTHNQDTISNIVQGIYPVSEVLESPIETQLFLKQAINYSKENILIKKDMNISHTTMIFGGNDISSISTISDLKHDSFHGILNLLSSMDEGYFSRYQISIIPANDSWKDNIKKRDLSLQNYKEKKSLFKEAEKKNSGSMERSRIDSIGREKGLSSNGYYLVLRVAFIGDHVSILNSKLDAVKTLIHSLVGDKTTIEFHDDSNFLHNYYNSQIPPIALTRGSLFVPMEITSILHSPIPHNMRVKNLDVQLFQKLPMPSDLIKSKRNLTNEDITLGLNEYGTSSNIFALDNEARFRHIYALGKTGVGKSVFMHNSIMQDIYNGHGVCVIDPHGDLIDDIMEQFPDPRNPKYADRYKDLIYIDFGDKERQVGLNILEADNEHEVTKTVNTFISMLKKMFPESGDSLGPYFENYVRDTCKTIMNLKHIYKPTIGDIVRILQSEEYRLHAVDYLDAEKDIDLINFWIDHEKQTGEDSNSQNKDEIIPHIRTKFAPFLSNQYVNNVTGQEDSTVDFFDAMNTNKIILVRLSKGAIGPENMVILGLILITKLLNDVFKRESIPKNERKPFFLYVDEFQNFVTKEFESLFSEARKYNFGMLVANQYLDQLVDSKTKDDSVLKAVLGNAGTFVAFKAGSEDQKKLEEHFGNKQILPSEAFGNIEKYNAYVTTVGASNILSTLPPFTIKTIVSNKPFIWKRDTKGKVIIDSDGNKGIDRDTIKMIIDYSKSIYTRDQASIQSHTTKFAKLFGS